VQVALLREVARPLCRGEIGGAGRVALAGHLQQMRGDRGHPVVPGQPLVGAEPGQEFEPGPRAVHHGHRDGVVQPHDRVVR
jgi:hypothetical protein